ncbi:murein transglycosylase [Amycolatopsis endophytica]
MVGTGLVLILTIGVTRPDEVSSAPDVPAAPTGAPPAGATAPVPARLAPEDRPRESDLAELDSWSNEVASATKVPARLLAGYGRAEMWMRGEWPGCHLSWATLAAIGQAEAVGTGPLPVTEETWKKWSARASGDGKQPVPTDIDDAALTTARALCSTGADLATAQGWWAAVLGAPSLAPDAQMIITTANGFATAVPR